LQGGGVDIAIVAEVGDLGQRGAQFAGQLGLGPDGGVDARPGAVGAVDGEGSLRT